MKANAPEKIYVYIPNDDIVGTASTQKGFPHQFVTEEYTRTDAFIEEAVKWIEEINNYHHIIRYSDSCEPPIYELTEWFKNYMKEGGKE